MQLISREKFKKIKIFVESKKKTDYDTIYFGHIIIEKYRTWCYFTQSQIDYLSDFIRLVDNNEDYNKSSSNFYTKKKAIEEDFYFNTLVYHLTYARTEDQDNEYRFENKIKYNKEKVSNYKKIKKWHFLLSDKNEVILRNEKTHLLKFKDFYFSEVQRFNLGFQNEKEFYSLIAPRFKNKGDIRLFKIFFHKNKIYRSRNSNQINLNLIKTLLFIKRVFSSYEFQSFYEFKDILLYTYKNNGCFSKEIGDISDNKERIDRFIYILEKFSNGSILKTYKQWRFFSSYNKEISLVVEKLVTAGVNFSQYKNPFEAYHYLSGLKTKEREQNLSLPDSISIRYFGQDKIIEFKEPIMNNKLCLSPIKDFKDLCYVGNKLHNCAGSAETVDYYLKRISFKVIIDDELKFLGTIDKGFLTQLKGYRNKSPSLDIFNEILELLKDKAIINNHNYVYRDICVQSYR